MKVLEKWKEKKEQRHVKKYEKVVDQINERESHFESFTDQQLQDMTAHFKEELAKGKTVDDIKIDAFAVVREASKRVLGLRHFDVQLLGGLVLLNGNISEMPTGEGKTLVASLSSYTRALEGKGVHIITVNEYLARRDRELMGQIHEFLGLTVGLNVPMINPMEKKQAYTSDITYGIGTEFGFDYLRDNMAPFAEQRVQRPYHYAIIDEIDSVLIDEAKTPLIIAGKTTPSADLHNVCSKIARSFKEDVDYTFDRELRTTNFTDDGITKVERSFGIDNLFDLEHQTLYHYMIQALRAKVMFERDVDYIVQDGEVKLVDMNTGRIMDGRTLSDGLHQAIEAKEGLVITEENKTQASITIQNYFRMYPVLAGMTGTAKTEEDEFRNTYNMDVIQVPTNKPIIREDHPDLVFVTKEQKYTRMVEEVKQRHETGQPILIGTTSILQSETVAEFLDQANIPYQLLNAKSVEQEANLISLAGQKGQITIATNLAGRGTDIMLGEGAAEAGGLHVLGTERHESRRIDNQLKGRSGRQGDPGSTQFIISLEDEMMHRFAKEEVEKKLETVKADETGLVEDKQIDKFVDKVQRICEGSHSNIRDFNLKLDNVVNDQRKVVYELRDQIIDTNNVLEVLSAHMDDAMMYVVDKHCPEEVVPENWDLDRLRFALLNISTLTSIEFNGNYESQDDLKQEVQKLADEHKENLEKYMDNAKLNAQFHKLALMVVDRHWIKHLESMNRLKEGVGMRQYQQEDPIRLYQKEGLELFTHMFSELQLDLTFQVAKSIKGFEKKKGKTKK